MYLQEGNDPMDCGNKGYERLAHSVVKVLTNWNSDMNFTSLTVAK